MRNDITLVFTGYRQISLAVAAMERLQCRRLGLNMDKLPRELRDKIYDHIFPAIPDNIDVQKEVHVTDQQQWVFFGGPYSTERNPTNPHIVSPQQFGSAISAEFAMCCTLNGASLFIMFLGWNTSLPKTCSARRLYPSCYVSGDPPCPGFWERRQILF